MTTQWHTPTNLHFNPHSTTYTASSTALNYSFLGWWKDQSGKIRPPHTKDGRPPLANWAYSGRIRGPRPRSQPLVYPPPVLPAPHTQRPPLSSPRYGPAIPTLRPKPSFPQPPIYDRPKTTIYAPTLHPGDVHELQHTKFIQFVPLPYRLHKCMRVTLKAPQEAHRPHLPVAEEIILLSHKGSSTNHKAPTFVSTSSRIPLVLVPFKESTYQSASLIHPLHHSALNQTHSKFLFSWTIRERICSRGTR